MHEIFKEFTFEAAHFLPNVPQDHPCHRLHGHSYHVTVYVRGEPGAHTGWVIDYADISAAWKPLFDMLDHRTVNDVPGLENSTSENLAMWIHDRLAMALPGLHRVSVKETRSAGCTYYGPDAK